MTARIVILTNGNYFARIILSKALEKYHQSVVSIVVVTGDYKGRTGFKSLKEIFKETTFPYFFYKAFQGGIFLIAGKIFPSKIFDVEKLARQYGIPVMRCASVKEDCIINYVAEQSPDLILSVSCPQLIGKKILSKARLGGINIHSSLLPRFAGLAPYFWVLSNNQEITGTTVHYMTQRFDEGNILVQKHLTVEPGESAFNLFKSLAFEGCNAMEEAVPLALSGYQGIKQNLENYSYFSHPTDEAYKSLRKNGFVLFRLKEIFATIVDEVKAKSITTSPNLYVGHRN